MADEEKSEEHEKHEESNTVTEDSVKKEEEEEVKEERVEEEEEDKKPESAEDERIRLENEILQLEEEKEAREHLETQERERVERTAEEMARIINQNEDSSDDEKGKCDATKSAAEETAKQKTKQKPPDVPFFDLCLKHLLVGMGALTVDPATSGVYCGSCQKNIEADNLKFHIEGDGHKLNTLWNYDKSLAEVTGGLRAYPQKFEMEMFKHIAMLNRVEKRHPHEVPAAVETIIRDLYKDEPANDKLNGDRQRTDSTGQMSDTNQPEQPRVINPEELAEIKAEFIASFANADDAILVQQALMGELSGYTSENNAVTALRVAGMLGKMICAYQRKNLDDGYKANEECISDIKEQCSRLLKLIDESKIHSHMLR